MDLRKLLCGRKYGGNPQGEMKKDWHGDMDGCCTLLHFYWSQSDESVNSEESYLRGTGGGRKTVGEEEDISDWKRRKNHENEVQVWRWEEKEEQQEV